MKIQTLKLTILLVSVVSLSSFACQKENASPPVETPEQKTVAYHIFAAKDYSAPVYQNVNADLRLQVHVIDYKTGAMRLVWDSTFSTRKLIAFPSFDNKLVITKSFPVMNSHEKLNGAYSVRYNDNGLIKQEAYSDEAGPGTTAILIEADM